MRYLAHVAGDPGAGAPSAPNFSGITGGETPPLARQPNYDFEKRKKEQERKAKKEAKQEAKREERRQRQLDDSAPQEGDGDANPEGGAPPAE